MDPRFFNLDPPFSSVFALRSCPCKRGQLNCGFALPHSRVPENFARGVSLSFSLIPRKIIYVWGVPESSSTMIWSALHLQSNRPHQFECIALLHDSGTKTIVEGDFTVLKMILKMHVGSRRGKFIRNARQSEIMSCNQSNSASSYQRLDDA